MSFSAAIPFVCLAGQRSHSLVAYKCPLRNFLPFNESYLRTKSHLSLSSPHFRKCVATSFGIDGRRRCHLWSLSERTKCRNPSRPASRNCVPSEVNENSQHYSLITLSHTLAAQTNTRARIQTLKEKKETIKTVLHGLQCVQVVLKSPFLCVFRTFAICANV